MARFSFPLYATAAICAGPVLFWRGFRDLRTRRLMLNTPTARIRSMAMGFVEIDGTVLERSLVQAPFSGHECAYWEVDIAVPSNRRGGWAIVHRRNSGNPFYVSDGTGVALVYPQGSICKVPSGCVEECSGLSVPDVYGEYMKQQGLWQRHLWRLSALRFRERTLEEGARVFVLGSAEPRAVARDVSNPAQVEATGTPAEWIESEIRATGTDGPGFGGAGLPGIPPSRAAFSETAAPAAVGASAGSPPGPRFHASTAPHPRDALAPVIPIRGPGRVRALHDQVAAVIRRGRNEPTFIISAESETALATTLGISTLGNLAAGPLLTALGVGYWLLELSSHHGHR